VPTHPRASVWALNTFYMMLSLSSLLLLIHISFHFVTSTQQDIHNNYNFFRICINTFSPLNVNFYIHTLFEKVHARDIQVFIEFSFSHSYCCCWWWLWWWYCDRDMWSLNYSVVYKLNHLSLFPLCVVTFLCCYPSSDRIQLIFSID